jgi:hypothetical protein
MTELFYGKPEPVWVINNRRRGLGPSSGDGYYNAPQMTRPGQYRADGYAPSYGSSRGTSLTPDVTVRTPLIDMNDVARIKHVLSVQGVYNVVCDIPQQTVRVSSSLSPRTVVELIRQAMGTATLINYVDPMQPTFHTPGDRQRYSSYDDSYSYEGRTGYSPAYTAPYNGRSYDNEFRPSSYGGRSGYGSSLY